MTHKPIADVIRDNAPRLLALPGVSGVYEGATESGEPCIKVMVTPGMEPNLPGSLAGYPVVTVRSTPPEALGPAD